LGNLEKNLAIQGLAIAQLWNWQWWILSGRLGFCIL